MTRVKICGITNLEDAQAAVRAGADALGFVFAESPRQVTAALAAGITAALPPFIARVGVFVNTPLRAIRETAVRCRLTAVQLHGEEPSAFCMDLAEWDVIRAVRARSEEDVRSLTRNGCSAYLLDAYVPGAHGGTGRRVPLAIARTALAGGAPVILAGGLSPANVGEAVRELRPYAVDVSSGVEKRPGKKDHAKLRAFVEAVRRADADPGQEE